MKIITKAFICILALTAFAPTANAYVSSTARYQYQSYDYRLFGTTPNYTTSRATFTNSYVPYTNSYATYTYSYAHPQYFSYAPTYYYR